MEETITKELKGTTRIIVTHAIHYSNYADRIIIMDDGKVVADGTYQSIKETKLFKYLCNDKEEATENYEDLPKEEPSTKQNENSEAPEKSLGNSSKNVIEGSV